MVTPFGITTDSNSVSSLNAVKPIATTGFPPKVSGISREVIVTPSTNPLIVTPFPDSVQESTPLSSADAEIAAGAVNVPSGTPAEKQTLPSIAATAITERIRFRTFIRFSPPIDFHFILSHDICNFNSLWQRTANFTVSKKIVFKMSNFVESCRISCQKRTRFQSETRFEWKRVLK